MKIKELIQFNEAFRDTKVVGLGKDQSIKYFKLKIAVSEEIAKIAGYEKAAKEQTRPGDVEDENNLTEQQFRQWKGSFEQVLLDYQDQNLDKFPDTHILSEDELYDSILSVELNKEMNTERKSLLMKYLVR